MEMATMTAPLQVIALSFSRDDAEDRILAEVDRLRGRGVLRLLDMLFVAKSQDGSIERLAIGDDEDFGSLLAAVGPIASGGTAGADGAAADGAAAFDPAYAWALADSLQPGTALAFLLVEHNWAAPLFDAIAETGGTLIGEGFLTADEVAAEATGEAEARVQAASITTAEAQVLRYLAKPLPFSVIADKLGISRSAAKERAIRLYKRLGVHTRDEAVSRARSLGLIRGE